jgi:hypothetical protein
MERNTILSALKADPSDKKMQKEKSEFNSIVKNLTKVGGTKVSAIA